MEKRLFFVVILWLALGCSKAPKPLFRLISPPASGIAFSNDVIEDEYMNILSNEYIYNGAGVGIGDFNGDGLQDIYFCGSQESNRLYLNKGQLTFEDVTLKARVAARDRWSTGVAVVDINQDRRPDIYVCASNSQDPESRANKLFINEGPDKNGVPQFAEKAHQYGIDDDGYSTMAAFFDYDNDGDLDLYVLTNYLDTPTPNKYRPRKTDGSAQSNDRLYRNNGNGTFTNVTRQAGIVYEGYGMGISIVDVNEDGYRDIYITNDYLTNDLLYINQHDGTFTNAIGRYIKHQTHSAMGHDIADINNDGWVDIFTLDMLPEDNDGIKKMHGVTRYQNEQLNKKFGYQPQYKRNMLQLNNGPDAAGQRTFSEIGLYAGVYATEWSWAPLLADFDNDGWRDLFVSNGYPRDVTDLDYAVSGMARGSGLSNEESMKMIPVRKMSNYLFKNRGDLTFSNVTKAWGLSSPTFANGAAFVDLDNDGDLELVTNNYNEPAQLYENTLYEQDESKDIHFLGVRLDATSAKTIGARVWLFAGGAMLFEDHSPFRGFRSTVDPVLHFGLGKNIMVDSLRVAWPDGRWQVRRNVPADQVVTLRYAPAEAMENRAFFDLPDTAEYLFVEASKKCHLAYHDPEHPFDDYRLQATLPHQLSQSGPPLAVADLDGNGLEDLVIGGSAGQPTLVFYQHKDGFRRAKLCPEADPQTEDVAILLFDADGDGATDVYVVSGGVENGTNPKNYLDRMFINRGNGRMEQVLDALPEIAVSGSCVKGADIDGDGDTDLFVGGRVLPGSYPQKVPSYILRNDSKPAHPSFTNITTEKCPEIHDFGLVTDALWSDFNDDGRADLVIIGEWMPISFFVNTGDRFKNITPKSGIADKSGWWNSLAQGDFDEDGDIDFIAGNEGLNSYFRASPTEPLTAYSADFDNNGRYDVVIGMFVKGADGTKREYPVHFRSDLAKQLPATRKKFTTYEAYSHATLRELLSPEELKKAQKSMATIMSSCYIENQGAGHFALHPLPRAAQMAPINSLLAGDFNHDGHTDVLLAGNNFGNSPFWGSMDALNGLFLSGNGRGDFKAKNYTTTGYYVPGDARTIVQLSTADHSRLIVTSQNQDSLMVYQLKK